MMGSHPIPRSMSSGKGKLIGTEDLSYSGAVRYFDCRKWYLLAYLSFIKVYTKVIFLLKHLI